MEIAQIKAAKRKHGAVLKALPHVLSLGIGPKVRAGQPTGELALKVYVDRKVDPGDLAEEDRIPPRLDGVPTDVEVADTYRAR